MIHHLLSSRSIQLTLLGSILFMLADCRPDPVEEAVDPPPKQRVKALTTLNLRLGKLSPDEISLDTVMVAGTVYNVVSFDSTVYSYDEQKRLTSYVRTQTGQAYGRPHTSSYRCDYAYQPGVLSETFLQGNRQATVRYPLESTNNRVTAYTREYYSAILVDTLRKYSPEGILLETLEVGPNSRKPNFTTPTRKITVESGNIVKQEEYNSYGGNLQTVARYVYDVKRYAPLSTFTFLGETSRNAVLKIVSTHTDVDGSRDNTYTYQNEYDGQGRMTRQLEKTTVSYAPSYSAFLLTRYYYR